MQQSFGGPIQYSLPTNNGFVAPWLAKQLRKDNTWCSLKYLQILFHHSVGPTASGPRRLEVS